MGSGRNLSGEKRAQAVALANAGYSQIHIASAVAGVLNNKNITIQRNGLF